MTVARSVARNSLVQFGGRGITMTVQLATLTLLSRYMGPEEFGHYQVVIAFLLLLNLTDLGISTIAARHLSTDERSPEAVLGNVLAIRAVLSVVSIALAIMVALVADYTRAEREAIAVASLSFPLMLFSNTYNAIFVARLRMEYSVLGNVAQSLTSLALMGVVAATNGGLIRMLVAYDAGFLANSLICLYFARKFVRPSVAIDGRLARRILRDTAPLGAAIILTSVYGRIDIVLLRSFTDGDSVGYYGFAYRAIDLAAPLSFLFIASVFPLLARYHAEGDGAELRRLYQRAHDILTIFGLSMLTMMILFARPIVEIVGGDAYEPAVTSLRILSMAFGLIWLSNLADYGLIAVGQQRLSLLVASIGLVVNLSSNAVLIPLYGSEGAAVATVLTEVAVLAPAVFLLSRYIGGIPSFWVAWRLVPVAILSGAVVYLLNLPWFSEAAVACLLLVAGIAVSRVVSISDVRALLRREPAEVARGTAGAGGTT
jgi:O-antigen/teichoic acid export membrane protein